MNNDPKIITDTPETNMQTLHNYCRYKDRRAVFAETIDGSNIDIYEYCQRLCNEKCNNIADGIGFHDFLEHIIDCESMVSCPVSRLYISAVQAAELRDIVKNYENKENTSDRIKQN